MYVIMQQRPVGQGGFFVGEIGENINGKNPVFRWVYDCGSTKNSEPQREIDNIYKCYGKDNSIINYLFLSHLHQDHVSGVPHLLSKFQIKEIVMPYFDNTVILAIIAEDFIEKRITIEEIKNSLKKFPEYDLNKESIKSWFLSEKLFPGISEDISSAITITLIDTKGGKIEDGPDLGNPESPSEDSFQYGWSSPTENQESTSSKLRIRKVKRNAAITFTEIDWALVPYVQPTEQDNLEKFKDSLKKEFEDVKNIENIHEILNYKNPNKNTTKEETIKENLKTIKTCYERIWNGNHNLLSMSLYSGPIKGIKSARISEHGVFRGQCFCENQNVFKYFMYKHMHSLLPVLGGDKKFGSWGWMLTGDSNFKKENYFSDFSGYYKPKIFDLVGIFMLPHHGSECNYNLKILENIKNLKITYAAHGKYKSSLKENEYKHPSGYVVYDVAVKHGECFHSVNDSPQSLLTVFITEMPTYK